MTCVIKNKDYVNLLKLAGDIHPNPGPNTNISLCHINIHSMFGQGLTKHSKLDEIHSTLCVQEQYDIIAVTETWLDGSISDECIELLDYQVFRKDRNRHGGGVLAYTHNSLAVTQRLDIENNNTEVLWLEVHAQNKMFLVAVCYRPPGMNEEACSNFIENLQEMLDVARINNPDSIFLIGDFNDRCQDWDSPHNDSELKQKLYDWVTTNNMFQIIADPTYYTTHSANILDLCITDSPGFITDSGVLPPVASTDHCLIFCKFKFMYNKEKSYMREVWDYKNGDFVGLNTALSTAPWETGASVYDSIDDMALYWSDLFLNTCKDFIPFRKVKIRPRDKPWMTSEIRRLLRIRDRQFKRFKRTRRPEHEEVFKRARSDARKAMDQAKVAYREKLVEKLTDPTCSVKTFWKVSKELYGVKVKSGIPPILENGNVYSNTFEKAELFNEYFTRQSSLPTQDMIPELPPVMYLTENRLDSIHTSSEEVTKILKSLNVNKSHGPDGISQKLLKETSISIAPSLTALINKSFEAGEYPTNWKMANTTPVFKNGDKNTTKNYRPISLLSCVGKVQERVAFSELYKYCI